MKVNKILIIVLVLLIGMVAWFYYSQSNSTLKDTLKIFTVEDTAAVDKLFFADKNGNTSTLTRKSATVWMVNDTFLARADAVKTVLETLKKMKVRYPVAKSMEQTVLKELSGPSQRKVEVYSNGELIKTIYMANESMDKKGTYMLLEGDDQPYEVHVPGHNGFLQTRFIVNSKSWRDPSIFSYDYRDIRNVVLKYNERPEVNVEIAFDGAKGVEISQNGKKVSRAVDTLAAIEYLAGFKRINYEFIVAESFPKAEKDSIVASLPWLEITVTDKNKKVKTFKGFHRYNTAKEVDTSVPGSQYDSDRMYALVNSDKDFVLVQFFQLNPLIKPLDYFLKQQ
jgi:hypothetical protein